MFSAQLKKGSMDLLILSVLDGGSYHGYEIGKRLSAASDQQLELRASTLYSALYRMEERGWIRGRWVEREGERRRCYYRMSEEGAVVLAARRKEWKAFSAMVDGIIGVEHA